MNPARGAKRLKAPGSVILLAIIGACGEGAQPDSARSFEVDSLDGGRVRVSNTGPIWSESDRWRIVEELRLGTVDGEGPEQFGQIAALKADSAGRIYVLDFQAQDIRVFNSDGSHSHTIGQRGDGPGELSQAAGLNWGPDGNLWVWGTRGRFSVFRKDGGFVEAKPRRVLGVIYPWRGEFDGAGALVDWGIDFPGVDLGKGESPTRMVFYPVRFAGDFEVGDTLPELAIDFELSPDGERVQFTQGLSVFLDRSGTIWFAQDKDFTIYRRTLEGDTTLEFSIPAVPAEVTASEVDSIQSIFIDQGRPEFAPSAEMFSDTKPMIRRIFGDGDGHIMVLSDQAGLELGAFVDVFLEDGRYLGRADLPARVNFPFPPPYATPTHLYYVTTDDLGVEYVVRARIDKSGAAGP